MRGKMSRTPRKWSFIAIKGEWYNILFILFTYKFICRNMIIPYFLHFFLSKSQFYFQNREIAHWQNSLMTDSSISTDITLQNVANADCLPKRRCGNRFQRIWFENNEAQNCKCNLISNTFMDYFYYLNWGSIFALYFALNNAIGNCWFL